MASLNKVLLMGNLTKDPELRYTPNGMAVCDLSLAMNRKYSSNGQDKEEVCFVDIVVWAKQAESCGKYLHKGSPVFVEGRLRNDNWEDKDGNKRSRMRITAERVQFLSSNRGGEENRQQPNNPGNYNNQGNSNTGNYSNYNNQQPQATGYQQPSATGYQQPSPAPPAGASSYNDQNYNSQSYPRKNSNQDYNQNKGISPEQKMTMPPPPAEVFDNNMETEDDIPF